MRPILLLLAGALCLVLVAACGDDDDSTPTPEASPTSNADGTTPTGDANGTSPTSDFNGATPTAGATQEPGETPDQLLLPVTPVLATLTETFRVPEGNPPTADELPVSAGTVRALWYQSGGRYVVYYGGLFLPASGPLCPGNSILTDSGFQHISNAPTAEGACEGATNLAAEPAGVKFCGEKVLYLTEIPVETEGTLFGTIEVYLPDGTIIGLTSRSETDAGAAPEINLSSCSDAVT